MSRRRRPRRPALLGRLTLLLWAFGAVGLLSAAASAQTIPVRGRVLDAAGAPVVGAKVELVEEQDRLRRGLTELGAAGGATPAAVRTDRRGEFLLPASGPGMWKVRVSQPGRVAMAHPLHPLLEDADLEPVRMLPEQPVSVLVVGPSGEPVAEARVEVRPAPGEDLWPEVEQETAWRPDRRAAWTDEAGRALLPRAAGEVVEVGAFSPDFAAVWGSSAADPLRLTLPGAVPGRLEVVDHQGRPVRRAVVRWGEEAWVAGTTDDRGAIALPLETATAVPVRLDLPEGWSVHLLLSGPAEGERAAAWQVRLPAPLRVMGRVLDRETRAPLAGALAWIGDDPREALRTDAAGRFATPTEPVDAADVPLAVAHPGYLTGSWGWEPKIDDRKEIDLTMLPALSVHGVVVDAEGEGVVGAEVAVRVALRPGWLQSGRDLRSTQSRDGGRFRISGLLLRQEVGYEVRARAEGFAPASVEIDPRRGSAPLRLILGRGGRLVGRVVDEAGRPVGGARVRLFETVEDPTPVVLRLRRGPAFETAAGEDGGFVVRDLPPDRFDLTVEAEGFAATGVPGVEAPAAGELDLGEVALSPGATVQGRVTDAAGVPLEGARVAVGPVEAAFGSRRQQIPPVEPAEAVTNVEGRFGVNGLPRGESVSIRVSRSGYVSRELPHVELAAEEPIVIALRRAGRIFGTVVDTAGHPLRSAEVRIEVESTRDGAQGGTIRSSSFGRVSRTDADGLFSFDGLAGGSVRVHANRGDLSLGEALEFRLEERQEMGPLRLVLRPGAVVEGRVLDPTGTPAAGATVNLNPQGDSRGFGHGARAEADGGFRFAGLRAGTMQLRAEDRNGAWAERTVEAGTGSVWVELVLEAGPAVSGQVVDPRGEPVALAQVRLIGADSGTMRGSQTDLEGRFSFAQLQPGRYHLTASAPGWSDVTLDDLAVEEGRPVSGIVLRLAAGVPITGTLYGVEAEALGRLTVTATGRPGQPAVPRTFTGAVHFDGTYRIPGVSPGKWRVTATLPDGRVGSGEVEIVAGQEEAVVDLTLDGGLVVQGVVRLNGRPLPAMLVRLAQPLEGRGEAAYTDSEGRFRVGGLEPGSWVLEGFDAETGLRVRRTLDLRADREVAIDVAAGSVRGRLVTREGLPAHGLALNLIPADGVEQELVTALWTRTDAQGRFGWGTVPLGFWELRSAPPENRLRVRVQVAADGVDLGDVVVGPPLREDFGEPR